ncbi:MAG: FeoA family protein [Sedimentisphaerales bacterium]|jgi:Fe2+ transport system protein FeoA
MDAMTAKALSEIEEGARVTVVGIQGGRGIRSRLTAMGLLPGARITVLRNGGSGPFVVSIKNSRMALGRGVADKIMVTE